MMYRKIASILFPITLIVLIAVSVWGYRESQDKSAMLMKAENQYQRAFHSLNDHMDKLQDEIGKSLALNSRRQTSTAMTNVWRLAYAAQSDLSELPLAFIPFDKTEDFVFNIGKFAHEVGVRDLHKHPLNEKERNTLQILYKRSSEIRNDLQQVQTKVLDKHLQWTDVEVALATGDKKVKNMIIDGFKGVNQKVEAYPEMDWGPSINNMEIRKRENESHLKGKPISPLQAKQKVAQALGWTSTDNMTVQLNKKGEYETYSVACNGKEDRQINADVTVKGGNIVWMMSDRPVKNQRLDFNQSLNRASHFLQRLHYPTMVPISYEESGNTMDVNFVHKEKDIYVYPQVLSVKVALDNGEIIGLQAAEYVFNSLKIPHAKPKLAKAAARKQVNPKLKVQKSNLALIYNESGNKVLCYEFLGMLDKEQFRVLINANTGEEEMIEKIEKANIDSA